MKDVIRLTVCDQSCFVYLKQP